MRIDAISEYLSSVFVIEPPTLQRTGASYTETLGTNRAGASMFELLQTIQRSRDFYFQRQIASTYDRLGSTAQNANYEMYLQFPNQRISELARSIVEPSDADDQKADKIAAWVQENFEQSAVPLPSTGPTTWTFPTVSLHRGWGDDEAGALLVHSLLLNAGVPYDRVRTYGESQQTSFGVLAEEHAVTAYRRESDDAWVALDWGTDTELSGMSERTPLRFDSLFPEKSYYVDALGTVETGYLNSSTPVFLDLFA